MSAITLELETALAGLGPESAQRLEAAVREDIQQARSAAAEWAKIKELMQVNHPLMAECMGMFADTDFQRAHQGELPPAKL